MALVGEVSAPPLRNRWPSIIAFSIFVCALLFVGSRHEPWADEAQAWLLARDNSLFALLTHAVRYEGSPGLWHAILWFFERAGLPFSGLWLISAAFAGVAAVIILAKAPFPLWLRIACVFSYFFAYQYAIIARSYALDLVLIPLLAVLFQDRLNRPIAYGLTLGLLANANAYSFIIADVLSCEFLFALWREQRRIDHRIWISGAIFALLALAAIAQAWPPSDIGFHAEPQQRLRWVRLFFLLGDAFTDRIDVLNWGPPNATRLMAGAVTVILLIPSFILFKRAHVLALFIATMAMMALFSLVEYASAWHSGFLYLVWIFCLWISWHAVTDLSSRQRVLLISSILLLSLIQTGCTLVAWMRDVETPYSAGPAAAAELAAYRESHPSAAVAAIGYKAFSVQPWFSVNIFANYNNGAPKPAYYDWRKAVRFPVDPDLRAWADMASKKRYDILLLSTFHVQNPNDYVRIAEQNGYCVRKAVPGGMIWKALVFEPDDLLIFGRQDKSNACRIDEVAAAR